MTLHEELRYLETLILHVNAMFVANNEVSGCHSSGCVFWAEQYRVVAIRIEKIRSLLSLQMPHMYSFSCFRSSCMHWVEMTNSAWPTRSLQLAETNKSYFYVPDGWDEIIEDNVTPLWQKLRPEENGFFHLDGFS